MIHQKQNPKAKAIMQAVRDVVEVNPKAGGRKRKRLYARALFIHFAWLAGIDKQIAAEYIGRTRRTASRLFFRYRDFYTRPKFRKYAKTIEAELNALGLLQGAPAPLLDLQRRTPKDQLTATSEDITGAIERVMGITPHLLRVSNGRHAERLILYARTIYAHEAAEAGYYFEDEIREIIGYKANSSVTKALLRYDELTESRPDSEFIRYAGLVAKAIKQRRPK